MLREQNSNYKLYYKTAGVSRKMDRELGWVVGWIEENKHPYFFVLNIESTVPDRVAEVRIKLLKDILAHLGFFNGKK